MQVGDGADAGKYLDAIRVSKPLPMAQVSILTAREAYDYVLAHAGAVLPARDAVDKRVVEEVRTGKIVYTEGGKTHIGDRWIKRRLPDDSYKQGIITHPSQVGGYPSYTGTPYKDADGDGMPDKYETEHGLNPRNAADAAAIAKSGYAHIEEYLNGLVDVLTVKPAGDTKLLT